MQQGNTLKKDSNNSVRLETNNKLSVLIQYDVSPRCPIHQHSFYCLRHNKGQEAWGVELTVLVTDVGAHLQKEYWENKHWEHMPSQPQWAHEEWDRPLPMDQLHSCHHISGNTNVEKWSCLTVPFLKIKKLKKKVHFKSEESLHSLYPASPNVIDCFGKSSASQRNCWIHHRFSLHCNLMSQIIYQSSFVIAFDLYALYILK